MNSSDLALASVVSIEATEAQFGEIFEEPERTQVGIFIERVLDEMLTVAPNLESDLAAGRLRPVRVRGVGVDVVIRAIEDSRIGYRVVSTEFPEIKNSFAPAASASGITIALTADEIARLQPAAAGIGADSATLGGPYVISLSG